MEEKNLWYPDRVRDQRPTFFSAKNLSIRPFHYSGLPKKLFHPLYIIVLISQSGRSFFALPLSRRMGFLIYYRVGKRHFFIAQHEAGSALRLAMCSLVNYIVALYKQI